MLIHKDPTKGIQANNFRPIALSTDNVEATDWNHGREAVPTPGEEWIASK